VRKTIFFEEKYNTDISRFSSIEDVDSFIEGKTGKKLKVKKTDCNLITRSGNIFDIISYNVKNEFRRMLGIKK
jgi:hypothetical protein